MINFSAMVSLDGGATEFPILFSVKDNGEASGPDESAVHQALFDAIIDQVKFRYVEVTGFREIYG